MRVSLCLLALACAVCCAHVHALTLSSAVIEQFYTHTPAGLCLTRCVNRVPSGSQVTAEAAKSSPSVHLLKPCVRPQVELEGRNSSVLLPVFYRDQLPPDYDGWLAYTAYNISGSFNSFIGNFSVPNPPQRSPHILYLFTGLQNKDWVPLHDPESEGVGFDILQPVLQYPGDYGDYWSVKSWYVTLEAGAVASDEVRVTPGDVIFGNMTRLGADKWLVNSVNMRTGESTSITPSHSRLATQPWAYNVMEAYGVSGCDDYPDNGSQFSGLQLFDDNGQQVTATWRVNPKPDSVHKCKETVSVQSPTSMLFTFQ
eukprot:m.76001 g.76001  ORF g.76001 m.76001 type:complete len:312 (+) comp14010_c1_seq1:52-987(+)